MVKKKEITKDEFIKEFKEVLKEKNKKNLVPEKVREGIWPFKVDKGIIWNIGNCIFFECDYKRIIDRHKVFAINGNAIMNRKHYGASKLPKHLKISHNIYFVNDLITYGLEMSED